MADLIHLRGGHLTEDRRLDRLPSATDEHLWAYPLRTADVQELAASPRPMAIGVNWYPNFWRPRNPSGTAWSPGTTSPGPWWIGLDRYGELTKDLGIWSGSGHAICLKHRGARDDAGWWAYYDQHQEGRCFPAGTLVEMADGSHKPIEDVRTRDWVRTAEGREGMVRATGVRLQEGGLVALKLRGHRHLRATPEHPVLTGRGYVPIGELVIGDRVWLPSARSSVVESVSPLRWVAEREARVTTNGTRHFAGVAGRASATAIVTKLPEWIVLDATFGRIVGLWLAEGTTTANKVVWHFGGHERDTLVADLMDCLRTFGCEPRLAVRGNGALVVAVYGKHWRLLFERMLSLGPYDKRLPGELASGPPAFLMAVLRGWLDGDGHRRPSGMEEGVTVSHALALSMFRIAQTLGMAPTISRKEGKPNRSAASRRTRWDVYISDGQQAQVQADGVWRKVVGIEHEDFAGHVFNLSVEGDESYVAEGIGVHNCVQFAVSRMQTLLNRKRYEVREDWPAGRWLYHMAQMIDEWPGGSYVGASPAYEGTSVRAALEVVRQQGLVNYRADRPSLDEGISEYRWARDYNDVKAVLGYSDKNYCDLLNSWGRSGYPHLVRVPDEVGARLHHEDGEFGVVVDRPTS